jgi:membrane protease YdiL (CAAX protease family)
MEPLEPGPEPILEPKPPDPQPPERPPRIALRASLLAILFVIVLSLVAGVAGLALNHLTGGSGFESLAGVLAIAAAFPGAGWVAILTVRRRPREYLPLAVPGRRTWVAAAVLGLGTVMLNITLPVRLFAMDSGYLEMVEAMLTDLDALVSPLGVLLLLGVLVPLCEEVLFRGVILRSLLDRWSTWTAILVSALIFGLFHLHPVHALIAFVLGIAAGWAMVVTGSLWAAVAVHLTNNLVAVGTALLAPELEAVPLWVLAPAAATLAVGVVLLRPFRTGGRAGPEARPLPEG